jgi:hypothetical protein
MSVLFLLHCQATDRDGWAAIMYGTFTGVPLSLRRTYIAVVLTRAAALTDSGHWVVFVLAQRPRLHLHQCAAHHRSPNLCSPELQRQGYLA